MCSVSAKTRCHECKSDVSYDKSHCDCGAFIGFPNHRHAQSETAELDERYQEQAEKLLKKGLPKKQDFIENIADKSSPVICMPVNAAHDILIDRKYLNYLSRVSNGSREIAEEQNHRDRLTVEAQLFPGYEGKIIYAALSHNGSGLTSYGDFSIALNVDHARLERRITVHEENSYDFYQNHGLGALGKAPPKGYFSIWSQRQKIAVTKIADKLNHSIKKDKMEKLFFSSGLKRADDIFIEVCIYAEQGLSKDYIASIHYSDSKISADKDLFDLVLSNAKQQAIPLFKV